MPSLRRQMLKIITPALSIQPRSHESVSRYRGVWAVLPTDIFRLLLSLAIFWLVRRVLVPTGTTTLSGIRRCSTPRSIAACFFDIATVRLRLK